MNTTVLGVLIVVNIPVYYLFWKWLFGSWEEFWECLRFWLTPDIISAFRGEYFEDFWSEMKLAWWLLVCAFAVGVEYFIIARFFL